MESLIGSNYRMGSLILLLICISSTFATTESGIIDLHDGSSENSVEGIFVLKDAKGSECSLNWDPGGENPHCFLGKCYSCGSDEEFDSTKPSCTKILTAGEIVLIVVGALVPVVIFLGISVYCFGWRATFDGQYNKRSRQSPPPPPQIIILGGYDEYGNPVQYDIPSQRNY